MTSQTPTGRLSIDELRSLVSSGDVDTILLAFVDMQGRRLA